VNVFDAAFGVLDYGQRQLSSAASTARRGVGDIAGRALDDAVDGAVGVLVRHHVAERVVAGLLASGTLERVVSEVVESPQVGETVGKVVDSQLVDEMVGRILAGDEVDRIVAHVAASPELRAAIAQSSAGMAGEVAARMRSRTVVADARAERVARRLMRRTAPPPESGVPAPPETRADGSA
jgi:hypothetical protein